MSLAKEFKASTQIFQEANNAYLKKDYKAAQGLYSEILIKDPLNAVALTNAALTEFQLGQKYLALGLLRKALHNSPELEEAHSGLKFISAQVPSAHSTAETSNFEKLRNLFLVSVPQWAYFALSILCFAAAGWILISYVERRKRALETERAVPSAPWIGILISILFLSFLCLFTLKVYDNSVIRGTIIEEQVALQTAPGENQVTILNLAGGQEVKVVSEVQEWAQVLAAGKPAGWVKKSSLLMTR